MAFSSRNTTPKGERFGLLWAVINGIQAIYAALWSALWITLALLVRLVTGSTRIPLFMARACWAPGLLWAGAIRLEVAGLEHLDFSQPCFFAANHRSLFDVVALYRALPVPLLFIVKEELRCVPFLGWYMSAMGMIFIRRQQHRGSLESMQQCGRRLAEGQSILIFPEGTRSLEATIGRLKPGAFLPAIEAGAPIVPVAIRGTGRILPPGGFRVRPGRIRVAVGRPISTEGLDLGDRREVTERVSEEMARLWDGI